MKLYEIDEAIEACVDMETGEIIDPDRLDALMIQRDEKIEGVALWIKNLLAEATAIKAEKDALAKRQSVAENKAESLKGYLLRNLSGEKFRTPKVSISYRSSDSVEVFGEVPEEFLKPQEPKIDKAEIKKRLKAGEEVVGARLVSALHLQIK